MDGKSEKNITKPPDLDIPPHVWEIIHEFLLGIPNPELDLREPHLRPSMTNIFPFILFIYGLLIAVGVLSNLAVFYHIIRYKLYTDPTYSFIINNVISDLMKCCVVLPLTLFVMVVQNWMLGELLCSFLPMLQDIPLHTTMLTFLLMAWDRYRMIRNPNKPRLPAFVCTVGTWLTSICLVLPYPIYIMYIDLGKYSRMSTFDGVGLCIINLVEDMKEYMRGIFLTMYAGPLATISYLYVRISRELLYHSQPAAVVLFETNICSSSSSRAGKEGRSRTDSHSTTTADFRSGRNGDFDLSSQYSRSSYRDMIHDNSRARYECTHDSDLDLAKEKRTQKYLAAMVTTYAICLCPLMILRLARLALVETYENTDNFDFTYTLFVWVAFLPTCSTPLLYGAWQMSRSSKERLRGYFRFSNRKLRQSCETVVTAAGTPAVLRAKCTTSAATNNRRDSMVQHQIVDEGYLDNISYRQDSFNSSS